ncbi:MAG TPA: hypothetical protein VHI11_11080 [Jiangellaceae bacterium]|jgi:hypothetical protein|nr:hypothetical protein [Jiangellaceae bacterium]
MRWQRLFDDLEAQVEQADQALLDSEVADRTRREIARVRLTDRLRASVGATVVLRLSGAGQLAGTVEAAGPDWVLVAERTGTETLVPLAAILGVTGLGPQAAVPGTEGAVGARLGLGYALRRIARDRSSVVVTLSDGSVVRGLVDRVGADAFDLTESDPPPASTGAGPAGLTVPFAALGALRRTI